ncbi:MAG: hypothetical protein L0I43_04340, partial [Leuconostoc sp.]|nr:hypothetical protein [Leuconostoc sp.]
KHNYSSTPSFLSKAVEHFKSLQYVRLDLLSVKITRHYQKANPLTDWLFDFNRVTIHLHEYEENI